MRNATLSNATVSTMSRLNRITSTRAPADCTTKLHHIHPTPTKIIGAASRTRRQSTGKPMNAPSAATPVISHAT